MTMVNDQRHSRLEPGLLSLWRLWMASIIVLLLLPASVVSSSPEEVSPQRWLQEAEEAYSKVDHYTAIFHKQERVGDKLLAEETVFLKFRKPLSIYMKWIKEPFKGREVLYAEGWNNRQMKAHEGGIIGVFTLNLNPKGFLAMRGNRHPVTDAGIGHLLNLIGENLRKGLRANEIEIRQNREEEIFSRKTMRIETVFPRERGYYGCRVIVHFDLLTRLPINIRAYDQDNQMLANYGYEDLKLNGGLTDLDFDPKNPAYKF